FRPRELRSEPYVVPAAKPGRIEPEMSTLPDTQRRADEYRIRLSRERGTKHAVMDVGEHTPELRVRRKRADRRLAHDVSDHGHPAPPAEMGERPDGQLLQQDHARIVGARKPNRIAEERVSLGWNCVAVEDVPCSDNQAHYSTSVRIVIADPSAFTPA